MAGNVTPTRSNSLLARLSVPPDSMRFFKFVAVGSIAAAANIGSRIAFSFWMGYVLAILLAYCVGLSVAFTLNKLFVFRETINPLHRQAFWFVIINLIAVSETLVVSLLLADIVFPSIGFRWHSETVAHAAGVCVPVITSFIGHKKFTFRES